jgi:hypothetical protein
MGKSTTSGHSVPEQYEIFLPSINAKMAGVEGDDAPAVVNVSIG